MSSSTIRRSSRGYEILESKEHWEDFPQGSHFAADGEDFERISISQISIVHDLHRLVWVVGPVRKQPQEDDTHEWVCLDWDGTTTECPGYTGWYRPAPRVTLDFLWGLGL